MKFSIDILLFQKLSGMSKLFYSSPNIVFPVRNPVHPYPDISKWDPEDYYDISKINEVS